MRVLIVEDSAFNAYCLTRLLQTAYPVVQVSVANDSSTALQMIEQEHPNVVILDGDLGVGDGINCNGPALADTIWQHHSAIGIISWSDSDTMRQAFAEVFRQHSKYFNEFCCWPKVVSQEKIRQSLLYVSEQFITPMALIDRPAICA